MNERSSGEPLMFDLKDEAEGGMGPHGLMIGMTGSGKSQTLMSILFGFYQADSGEISVDGKVTRIASPTDAIKAGIAFLTEDRKHQGLVLHMTVASNVTLMAPPSKNGVLDRAAQKIDGAFRDEPRGPHPLANVLVIFKPDQFEYVVPYLMVHRDGLDVLVHPLTEDAVADHTDFAMWLGQPVALNIDTLSHRRGGRLPSGVSA